MKYINGMMTGFMGVVMMIIAFSSKSIDYVAFDLGIVSFIGSGVFYYLVVIRPKQQKERVVEQ